MTSAQIALKIEDIRGRILELAKKRDAAKYPECKEMLEGLIAVWTTQVSMYCAAWNIEEMRNGHCDSLNFH